MATLYEITAELQAIDDLLIENGGDVTDPAVDEIITAWMEKAEGDFEAKVDNYCALIREVEARGNARQQEMERIKALATSDFNTVAKLKQRLKVHLEVLGRLKVQTPRFAVSVCKNGGVQPIEIDEDGVPQNFLKWVSSPDGEKIREQLKAGPLDFARLQERGSHLRVK